MGVTYRGSAIPLTEQRIDRMILVVSIGLVFALAVGGFAMAANIYGDQDDSPTVEDQQIVMDSFDPAENAQLQSLRELCFVVESESGCWGSLSTQQGTIDIVYSSIPDVLPLCIDNDYLAQWYVDILSFGGYQPWGGYIEVWQKGEFKGKIHITWSWTGKGDCCAYDYYRATFSTDEKICLESNQYPDVAPWMIDYPDGQLTIPGKCVDFYIVTDWTGCVPGDQPSQDFTIIHSHSVRALVISSLCNHVWN